MSDVVQAHGAARETVNLMRWADTEGVEIHSVDIVWERSVRARLALRVPGRAESRMATYAATPEGPAPVVMACREAALRSEQFGCGPSDAGEAEVVVVAEVVETPRLAGTGRRTLPIPSDMFVEEKGAMDAWLLACAEDRRIEAPARRPSERIVSSSDVWRSRAPAQSERQAA